MSITNRKDIAKELKEKFTKMAVLDLDCILQTAFIHIQDHVQSGSDVHIHNFGTFKKKYRAERVGRNPQTGEPITIKAASSIGFKQTKHK